MRKTKIVLLIVLVIFVGIQFIQPARNTSEPVINLDSTNSLNIPANVQVLLKNACYDCHSNATVYPWFSKVQPMGWLLASHIKKGKSKLNFDELGTYRPRKLKSKLKEIKSEIEDGSMPLKSYTLLHRDALLSDDERQLIINWVEKTSDSLSIESDERK